MDKVLNSAPRAFETSNKLKEQKEEKNATFFPTRPYTFDPRPPYLPLLSPKKSEKNLKRPLLPPLIDSHTRTSPCARTLTRVLFPPSLLSRSLSFSFAGTPVALRLSRSRLPPTARARFGFRGRKKKLWQAEISKREKEDYFNV